MVIKTLTLRSFRNFQQVEELAFPQQPMLVAAAPNATGKSNFLEAIMVLLRGKSFRARLDECVQWGEEMFFLQGDVNHNQQSSSRIVVRYSQPERSLKIEEDGQISSPVTFYSRYPLVLFLPEDTFLFHRGPVGRRNFFNQVLASFPTYLSALVQYHRALKQRNAALKDARNLDDVQVWTDLVVEYAGSLWQQRQLMIDFLSAHINELYGQLMGREVSCQIRLVAGTPNPASFADDIVKGWKYEKRYRYTIYGPHRDDLEVLVDGREVRAGLSRGQMRGLVLALKLAAYRFIKQTSGQTPLLLLDEVLGELDGEHQRRLLNNLPPTQTLLTSTTVPETLRERDDVYLLDLRSIVLPVAPVEEEKSPVAQAV